MKFIVIPFLVDLSKFCLKDSVKKENIITYCGYMGGGKDNLEDMIRIFYGDAYLYNNYRLVLIGDAEKDEFDKIKAFAKRVDLYKKIEFTGRLEHQEVIEYLMKSTIHILVRSDVDKNKGGFPSKLAEYLATAIPSIITNVGEVSMYLEDTNNIFFVEKNNNQLFTSKLVNVLK
ncbi:MAG: glycosyltransferase, partial [Bacteroidota bacterium]|nr:glycosyltransferase [Bacteroidota bacterium]